MPLSAGARLGPYEIVSALGAGGMGEVYKARDTRLDRTVAVKILPDALAADPQFRERFDREARAISHLTHPNICTLYDVGEHDGTAFLVMELLEGQTLAERLETGALPPTQALTVAIEIASALAAAHRAGIVHRDLKPGNVILTKAGAKLLDFGLAKTNAPVVTVSNTMAPTTPPGITVQGAILGTFQYMAPEQIEGLEADARTDIFAFGCVLFEMLTGRKAFEGKTPASLLGAILKDEPPRVSAVQPVAPPSLDRIVAACLAKDPDDRYQSARDLARELKWIAAGGAAGAEVTAAVARPVRARLAWMIAAVAGMVLVASSILAVRYLRETPAEAEPIKFTIAPPENVTFATPPGGGSGFAPQVAVSPSGRYVVFVANGRNGFQLWLRPLGAVAATVIPGTEDASFPFWSPDSRNVGFFANNKLKRVRASGGPPVVVCDVAGGRGGTWNRDDIIVFSSADAILHRVPAAGGVPQAASTHDNADEASRHRFPFFLPDGRHFVYTEIFGAGNPPLKPGRIRIGALDTMDTTTLLEADSSATFASGHLLFNRGGTLMAQGFDAASRQFTGGAFPIVENIANEGTRYASFSASDTGVLVSAGAAARPTTHLVWMDRAGRELGSVGEPAAYFSLALSSDERRVAVAAASGTPENRDIWILDVQRGTQTRFTFDPGGDSAPVWSPDDLSIVFQASREGFPQLRRKRLDGAGNEEPLLTSGGAGAATFVADLSADGRYVAYVRSAQGNAGSPDLWALPLFGDRKPFPLVQTPSDEVDAAFSPDGRWFAYQSNEGGQPQIYVQAFPPTGDKFQVSKNGGSLPVWRRDGKELFFVSPDSKMMAAAIDATGQFQGAVTPLFTFSIPPSISRDRQYAVTKDGRFLMNVVQQSTSVPLTVVVNWFSAVQK
jgi:eukaryotic-like serine/threonine-protein kinase